MKKLEFPQIIELGNIEELTAGNKSKNSETVTHEFNLGFYTYSWSNTTSSNG